MEDATGVVTVSTNIGSKCTECDYWVDGSQKFDEGVNHYVQEHGYKLLHVGSESSHGDNGIWNSTVAVLGKP